MEQDRHELLETGNNATGGTLTRSRWHKYEDCLRDYKLYNTFLPGQLNLKKKNALKKRQRRANQN